MSVKCYVSTCDNPVIGQCSGYKSNCGKFYCASHSSKILCADCAQKKADREPVLGLEAEIATLREKTQNADEEYVELAKRHNDSTDWGILIGVLILALWALSSPALWPPPLPAIVGVIILLLGISARRSRRAEVIRQLDRYLELRSKTESKSIELSGYWMSKEFNKKK
jgi:hypothetical protein